MDLEPKAAGNSCLYCIFVSASLSLFVVGLGNITGGVVACKKAESFNWYNGAYIILGAILVLLVVISSLTRRSQFWISCYLFLLLLCLIAEIGFTLGIIFYSDFESILGDEYASILRYSMAAGCVIVFLCLLVGFWYRGSLREAQFYKDNKHLINKREIKVDTTKTDAKREEMANKYERLKEKWEKS